jgi:hypothetical protein
MKPRTPRRSDVLGVDIGGVIIDRANDRSDTSFFGEDFPRTTPVPGAFTALRQLNRRSAGRVFLVSKCGTGTERRTRRWLRYHRFRTATRIPTRNLRFCRERREKVGKCRDLGVTHFVDDRLEILGLPEDVAHRFLLNPSLEEVQRYEGYLPRVRRVASWGELLRAI